MHKVLVNRLGGLSLPRKSVVRLTDMTLDVYRGRKTTLQLQFNQFGNIIHDHIYFSTPVREYRDLLLSARRLGGRGHCT